MKGAKRTSGSCRIHNTQRWNCLLDNIFTFNGPFVEPPSDNIKAVKSRRKIVDMTLNRRIISRLETFYLKLKVPGVDADVTARLERTESRSSYRVQPSKSVLLVFRKLKETCAS